LEYYGKDLFRAANTGDLERVILAIKGYKETIKNKVFT